MKIILLNFRIILLIIKIKFSNISQLISFKLITVKFDI